MSYAMSVQEDTFLHDLVFADDATLETVTQLTLQEEQAPAAVYHKFGPGVYIRELHVPKGTFAIGKVHKAPHMDVILKGSCTYYTSDGNKKEVTGPATVLAPAGRNIGVFTEDTVWLNVYATDKRDVLAIEADLFETSTALDESQGEIDVAYEAVAELEREDFLDAIAYLGFTPEQVSEMATGTLDLIPFPYGTYSVMVKPSPIHGMGLFATAPIKKGDFIAPGRIDGMRTPAGRYTNHSAVPNAEMVMDGTGDVGLYATEDIGGNTGGLIGDEILVNYVDAFLDTRIEE
jgi:hypothetical protein